MFALKKKDIDFNHFRDINIGQMSLQKCQRKQKTYELLGQYNKCCKSEKISMLGVIMLIVMALS